LISTARRDEVVGGYGFGSPAINDLGQLAFSSYLRQSNAGSDISKQGIRTTRSGQLSLESRIGDQAAGLPSGVAYAGGFQLGLSLNNAGRIQFIVGVSGGGYDGALGIWSDGQGPLSPVVLTGQHAPGVDDGLNFEGFSFVAFNNAGQTAFLSTINGGRVAQGIWATDRRGELQLIVKTGDLLEGAPGEFHRVLDINFQGYGGNNGMPSGFNDRGQVAFWILFDDETQGVFVSNLVAVPEPRSALLLILAGSFTASRRASRACRLVRFTGDGERRRRDRQRSDRA
jgi:hypothetical protein